VPCFKLFNKNFFKKIKIGKCFFTSLRFFFFKIEKIFNKKPLEKDLKSLKVKNIKEKNSCNRIKFTIKYIANQYC